MVRADFFELSHSRTSFFQSERAFATMEDSDLDAELLAVTDPHKRTNRGGRASESDGEFDGIADSDNGDDDDDEMLDDVGGLDDDDDDDDEYGLDDDDEEFGTKSSRKKKAKKVSKTKKAPSKSKSTKRRPRASGKRSARGKSDVIMSDNDDDEFKYKFDQYGYGDAADQEKLGRMNEVDRELILAERIEARNREYILWKKQREMMARGEDGAGEKRSARSSGRTKQSSKSDALQALAEDKRKKSARPVDLDVSDADSEPDPSSRRQTAAETERKERRSDVDDEPDDSGPGLKYSDLVIQDDDGQRVATPLFLRRDALIKLSQQAYFHRAAVGLFCRVRALSRTDDSYLLCRIVDANIGPVYDLGNGMKSNWSLVLQNGGKRKSFEIRLTSGSAPSEAEFDSYCRRSNSDDVELPRREEVTKLVKRSKELIFGRSAIPTDAELKKHLANVEVLYPSRVNWTQKLSEVKTALEIRRQDLIAARERGDADKIEKLEEQVAKMEDRVEEIHRLEEKYVLKPVKTNTEVFQSLAKRNMALNTTTERLAASRENLETRANGTNPFARFDTSGQSYFSIPSRDNKVANKEEKQSSSLKSYSDWRCLASTWDPSGKRRKVSEHALDSAYDTPLSSLHVFDNEGGDSGPQRRRSGLLPEMVDATYSSQACAKSSLPSGAKVLSLEEWSRQRSG